MKTVKLNTSLGKLEILAKSFNLALSNYYKVFSKSQGVFLGEQKIYTPNEGTMDDPSKRSTRLVQSTVGEKFEYFIDTNTDYIQTQLDIEATNSSGTARAELKVGDVSFGELSSLELLRLKSLIENQTFISMIESIPVRSDAEIWNPTTNELYDGRNEIFASEMNQYINKTTEKETYILSDPHAGESNRPPQVSVKTTVIELGSGSTQKFSGEWTQAQKATVLKRRTELLAAIKAALEEANSVELVQSKIDGANLLRYLLNR